MIGFNASIGFSEKGIRTNNGQPFNMGDYPGISSGYSLGLFLGGIEYSGNRRNSSYENSDWHLKGADYNQLGFGVFQGINIGLSWSRTNTFFLYE